MVATQSVQNFVLSITLALTRLPVLAGRQHEPTMQKRSEEKKNDRIAMQVLNQRVCHQKICCWSTDHKSKIQKFNVLKTIMSSKNIRSIKKLFLKKNHRSPQKQDVKIICKSVNMSKGNPSSYYHHISLMNLLFHYYHCTAYIM